MEDRDDIIDFYVTCYDKEKNIIPGLNCIWSVNNDSGGGIIDPASGSFDPIKEGQCEVVANVSGKTAKTLVTILPGKLHNISISPGNITITADDHIFFHARGYDEDGRLCA